MCSGFHQRTLFLTSIVPNAYHIKLLIALHLVTARLVAHLDLSRIENPVRLKAQPRQNTNEINNESEDWNV